MSSFFDKAKAEAEGYDDKQSGKKGLSGLASEGQTAYKDYAADKKDGKVDYKKEGEQVFGDLKQGFAGDTGAKNPPTN